MTTAVRTPIDVVRAARSGQQRRRRRAHGALVLAVGTVFFAGVLLGSYTVTIPDFVRIVSGADIPGASFIVMDHKLPAAVIGLLVGMAFGASGAVFQTMLRNPLASPDIIGITAGASASAVLALVVFGATGPRVSLTAFAGACAVALLMHLLARRGGAAGQRLVLIGIGIAALLHATTSYLLTRSDIRTAAEALVWLNGSLNNSTWDRAAQLVAALVVLLPLVGLLARSLTGLELGDDAAAGLGIPVPRARLGLLLGATGLAAVATAAAGPVAFVAFLSAPIARRIRHGHGSPLIAGLVGALIVLGAQLAADNLVPGAALPVGVVTGALGAPFLLYLLVAANRGGRGG